jgi:lantibiotic biosynthesis protein
MTERQRGDPSSLDAPAGAACAERAVWRVPELLTASQRADATRAAVAVCDRLRNPDLVGSAARLAASQAPQGGRAHNVGPGLAQGWAGFAVLFEHADRCLPEQGWAGAAQAALESSARTVAARPASVVPGIAAGWAGIAFATAFLSRHGQRYGVWREELQPFVQAAGVALADDARRSGDSWRFAQFDQISGLAGMVAALLPCRGRALAAVVGALAAGTDRPGGRPPWPTAPGQLGDESLLAEYPRGLVNLGLAHGLAGVVAALALAVRAGAAGAAGEHALDTAATWLAEQVAWVDGKPVLPSFRSLPGQDWPVRPGRTAWCYGPAGAARALDLAGRALGRAELTRLATELLLAALDQPSHIAGLISPTFCHGVAGVLHITARMAELGDDDRLTAAVPRLCDSLLAAFEPDSVTGFRDRGVAGNPVDSPALLSGAAGVALVLLSVAHHPAPDWDRAFLLS